MLVYKQELNCPLILGFTFDTILSILKFTALNPLPTVPLYLAALYTARGTELAAKHPDLLKWLKYFMYFGIFNRVKGFLDSGVLNNWSSDKYDWSKEVVIVTGGSDGIGARVVNMLAEKGITVVVLDIQPLKYEGNSYHIISPAWLARLIERTLFVS